MSNDSGVMEHIIFPSLSSASFASKRWMGSIVVIPTRTSSIAGMVHCEPLSKKITEQRYRKSRLPWNQRNWYPIAKHLAWRDYRRFQKRTQVHDGEHIVPVPWRSHQGGGPLKHDHFLGILPGIVLRLQSRSDKLEGAWRKSSLCTATLDAIEWQSCHGTHPGNSRGIWNIGKKTIW